jgi:hypothetical protein
MKVPGSSSYARLLYTEPMGWFKKVSSFDFGGHSRLGYYYWDKGLKDYVAVDLGVYHDLLLFDQ